MAGYAINNTAIEGTDGQLSIGAPVFTEVNAGRAYAVYPATFTDRQKGKPVTYTGRWTMTLRQTPAGWVITGSSSEWGGD